MGSSIHEVPVTAGRRFADSLRRRSDTGLVALLAARGDLAVPSPATLRSLAARASGHTSLERALTHVTALELQVAEAVTAVPGTPRTDLPALLGVRTDDLSQAAGQAIDEAVERVHELALVWEDDGGLRPSPGLDEVLGSYVAGLGPALPDQDDDAVARAERIERATADERAVLDALAWGPPVGRVPQRGTRHRDAVDSLVAGHLLTRADAHHVVLPRDVALALRGGRTHRSPALRPVPGGRTVPDVTVAAESARAALELVRRVGVLRTSWADDPPRVLRSGGLGVRELKRLADALDCDEAAAAFTAEIAAAAGLIRDDGEPEPRFVPVDLLWGELDDADRWAVLARAWTTSRRTPWRVGSRDDGGALRSALSEDLERAWVPRLRLAVLRILATASAALTADEVLDVLTWETPRNAPPHDAVEGLLAEAAVLGVTGAGALAPPGLALLPATEAARSRAGEPSPRELFLPGPADGAQAPAGHAGSGDPALALRAILPAEVDEILLQGDLTGVVPGRASRELRRLVELAADVESRGAATTVRFSAASVTRALDRGRGADDLLAAFARHSPVPVPQPLEYLIRDTARRHGAVRVGVASSYLRAADEVTLAGLEADPALAHLGLVRLAPTVLVAAVPPAYLHETLRERGIVSALEGPDGRVLDVRRTGTTTGAGLRRMGGPPSPRSARAVALASRQPPDPSGTAGPAGSAGPAHHGDPARRAPDLPALVAGLRAADTDEARQPPPGAGTSGTARHPSSDTETDGPAGTQPPADGLALLQEAVREGRLVKVDVVAAAGRLERRTLRPMRLEGGRLRALDPARDAEITVAVHRIARVAPDAPDPPGPEPSGAPDAG